ncbi:MAG: hypothetical protein FWG98_08260 [Candidatus Cloacimonetes bacterium]|nr:hypothetical protein [Candidatus Cloacimonadota bacterium]
MAKKVITMSDLIVSQSGKSSNGKYVFMALKNRSFSIKRKHTPVAITGFHEEGKARLRAASEIWRTVPVGFKSDLKRYVKNYNEQIQIKKEYTGNVTIFSIFIKIHYSHTLITTLAELSTQKGNTITEMIQKGVLPSVKGGTFSQKLIA